MLVSFSVENFMSFNDMEKIDLRAGKVRANANRLYQEKDLKITKFASVFGANSSGKSNLIEAINIARYFILHGFPTAVTQLYCRNHADNKTRPTTFSFEVYLDGTLYNYMFSMILSERRFTKEKLTRKNKTREQTVFYRDYETPENTKLIALDNSAITERLKVYNDDSIQDTETLFLNLMNTNKSAVYENYPEIGFLQDLYEWFQFGLNVNFRGTNIGNCDYFLDKDKKKYICDILAAYGTGITNYEITDTSPELVQAKMPEELFKLITNKMEKNRKDSEKENTLTRIIRTQKAFLMISLDQNDNLSFQTIEFNHENSDSTFNIQEESSGTTRLLDLLSILLYSEEDRTYVIDELDLRLHPDITVKFVKDFLQLATKKNIQLLITTHEYAIYDLSILRKDEIWMIDRSKGDSHIYSLNDYPEIRYDKKIIEAYEDNAFKAKPVLQETAPIFKYMEETN